MLCCARPNERARREGAATVGVHRTRGRADARLRRGAEGDKERLELVGVPPERPRAGSRGRNSSRASGRQRAASLFGGHRARWRGAVVGLVRRSLFASLGGLGPRCGAARRGSLQ